MSDAAPAGDLKLRRFMCRPPIRKPAEALRWGLPQSDDPHEVRAYKNRNAAHFERGYRTFERAYRYGIPTLTGSLWSRVHRLDGSVVDLGLVSMRVVTNNGVGFIVDAWQNTQELETMRYHGLGTGTNAEAQTDVGLQTELTTQYATAGDIRQQGSITESAQNVFQSVATITVDAAVAITEWGLFSTSARGAGNTTTNVMFDRAVFAAVNLASGESLEQTYSLTFPAGG